MLRGKTETMTCPYPEHGIKAWLIYCCNPFDQHNISNILREQVQSGQLELVVNFDFQRTTTSKWAHVNLPGVSWYEKEEMVSTPGETCFQPTVSPDGKWIAYYRDRAQFSAPGLIILEHAFIAPAGRASAGQLSIADTNPR